MGRKKGRPTKPDHEKKRSVSISLTRVQLEILDAIAERDNCNRSDVLSDLIQSAGFERAGVLDLGEIKEHISEHQRWIGPKTKQYACNPSNVYGMCQNVACQAIYSKEGLL